MVPTRKSYVPIKPFYVIGKSGGDVLKSDYTLVDAKGHQFIITDDDDKYSIGDSIK